MSELFRSSHSVYDCRYHLVWSTKYRKRALVEPEEKSSCKEILRETAEQYGYKLYEIEVDTDHVHIYIGIPPQDSVGKAVKILKSISARHVFKMFPYMRKKYWAGEFWEASYFVRSIGEGVTAEMVKNYIRQHENKLEPAQAKLLLEIKPTKKRERCS